MPPIIAAPLLSLNRLIKCSTMGDNSIIIILQLKSEELLFLVKTISIKCLTQKDLLRVTGFVSSEDFQLRRMDNLASSTNYTTALGMIVSL